MTPDGFDFTKAEALGNDFIIVDDRAGGKIDFTVSDIIALCDRRFGIGADGILLLSASQSADFRMRTLNSDGSEAEMCGNGVRCAAGYVYSLGEAGEDITVETLAGLIAVRITAGPDGRVDAIRVDLGAPLVGQLDMKLEAGGSEVLLSCVSMGNPHAIMLVDDIASAPVAELGPVIEEHEFFPEKTNVEFIKITDGNAIDMRVWERGAGETMACGTGAAAALAAANSLGLIGRSATLRLAGGDLFVEWDADNHIYITGNARMVFSGSIGER
jgi:diaminopimelate epimerase